MSDPYSPYFGGGGRSFCIYFTDKETDSCRGSFDLLKIAGLRCKSSEK